MNLSHALGQWPLEAALAIIAGIVILFVPRVLNYAVAVYLILIGALGILHFGYGRSLAPQSIIAIVCGILVLVKPTILNYVVGAYLILIGLMEAGIVRW